MITNDTSEADFLNRMERIKEANEQIYQHKETLGKLYMDSSPEGRARK